MKNKPLLKKLIAIVVFIFVLCCSIWLLRRPLMRWFGEGLIKEDILQQSDAIFILSGNPEARAKQAASLYRSGYAKRLVCTGESIPELLESFDLNVRECDLTKIKLQEFRVPETAIALLPMGTSTREECDAILAYCKNNSLKKIIVLSDRFHTARMQYAFRKQFETAGIGICIAGAPSITYNENMWWAKENGLIMVNNEYIKLMYYRITY
ncbi:MAG: YdcF family protein [Bacteroidia bacterium]|jgi:uncharacterized SAM-binding protein YcdF (DUF218 family)